MPAVTMLQSAAQTLSGLLFPTVCFNCSSWISLQDVTPLCAACEPLLPKHTGPFCAGCGRRQNLPQPCDECEGDINRPYEHLWFCMPYRGIAKKLMHRFKINSARDVFKFIDSKLTRFIENNLSANYDAVIPAPSHRNVWMSEFNASVFLAEAASRHLDAPILNCLERSKKVLKQTDLRRSERLHNPSGSVRMRKMSSVPRRVLLVDDVITTGATVRECARALRAGGVERVDILAFARG